MVISCDPAALVRSRGIVVYQAHKLQVIAFHMHRQLCRMWQLHEHWLNSVPEFNRIQIHICLLPRKIVTDTNMTLFN